MAKSYPYRSKQWMHWHGRCGRPLIHKDKVTGKTYVMIRSKGGGTARLYNYQRFMRDKPSKYYRKGKKLRKYKKY